MRRLSVFGIFAATLVLLAPAGTMAQDQAIRIIFPFAAGGSGDALARLFAERLQANLGRRVTVENRTGGSGQIGITAAVGSPADGSTILFSPSAPISLHVHSYKKLNYDPFTDLAPISQIVSFDYGLAINPATPAKTAGELVAWLKANPDKANYGTPGVGGLPRLTGILFSQAAKLELTAIPYRGSLPAITDLMAGQISSAILPISDLIPLHNDGKIRVVAVSGKARSTLVPDIPTLREQGFDIVSSGWYAFYVPAGTPQPVIAKLHDVLTAAVAEPELKKKILSFGFEPRATSPAELAALQREESDRWGPVIAATGLAND